MDRSSLDVSIMLTASLFSKEAVGPWDVNNATSNFFISTIYNTSKTHASTFTFLKF